MGVLFSATQAIEQVNIECGMPGVDNRGGHRRTRGGSRNGARGNRENKAEAEPTMARESPTGKTDVCELCHMALLCVWDLGSPPEGVSFLPVLDGGFKWKGPFREE